MPDISNTPPNPSTAKSSVHSIVARTLLADYPAVALIVPSLFISSGGAEPSFATVWTQMCEVQILEIS